MSQWSIGFDIFTDPEFTDGGYIPDHSILDEALHPDLDLQYDEPYYYGLIYMLFWFEPNPSYEGIYFAFNDIDNTDEFWVTQANVVTHCTPIPTSVWLLGSGLIGIVGIRRKFQK